MEGVEEKKEVKRFFKSCYNKLPFKTRRKAENFMEYQLKKFGKKLYLYDCVYCQNYHLTTHKPSSLKE